MRRRHNPAPPRATSRPPTPPLPFFQGPDYIHAKHMYDVQGMTHRKLKWGLGTVGLVGGGAGVVAIAIGHAQSKAKG